MDKPTKYFDSSRKPCKKTGSGDSSQMAYLTEKLTKLEKKLNTSKKHSNSKKCARVLSDSDIDSDQERVYGSTENQDPADKRLKLEHPTGIHLKSTDTHLSKSTKLALDTIRANKITIENSKTGKVTAIGAIRKVFGDKINNLPNKWLNLKKKALNRPKKHLTGLHESIDDASKGLLVKQKTIKVLLDTGSSGDLLFISKGSQKYIPTIKRAIAQSWGTSNGTFQTKKVDVIDISIKEYSASKSVTLTPEIVEYKVGAQPPLYDLIIGKQTLHNIGVVLDFREKTITIDSILLPMRNIVNLQIKPSVTRALKRNAFQAQEPISTQKATKRVIGILDAKYDKADLPEIVRTSCPHLMPSEQDMLLSLLLDYKLLFDGTLGDWNRPPSQLN